MLANRLQKKGSGRGAKAEEVEGAYEKEEAEGAGGKGQKGKERLTEAGSTPEGI
jgi:hypothetical protein